MDQCDALVGGGGPAGSSCAWALRRAGLDAVVLDRSQFPRDKVCAGWITPQIVDVHELPLEQRHDLMADMHLATPELALMVAKAVGVLPERTIMIGCQPVEIETLGIGLTEVVQTAVQTALTEIERCVSELQVPR